ncbi:hypothetical protein REC12_13585 [Desulfosporosinus sp. PR]|uniref:hypothetical protein n=1 Tax=Candidatus Desulfosporosinus nitrosoreducens TaxID=3401928 RepID=UPI0027FD16BE|nr:hypothetical protein [Desulfosporosinus sp. PR]MDQ7094623.1 hypothetical protein [Desulfosporosinus sp. PR]
MLKGTMVFSVSILVLISILCLSLATRNDTFAFNMPASIQEIVIQGDSAAGIGWTPYHPKNALGQVASWLNQATFYAGKVPQSQEVIHHVTNIGPARLQLYVSGKHLITIYPAYYIAKIKKTGMAIIFLDKYGKAISISDPGYRVQYVQNVIVFNDAGEITYLKSKELYNWLKTDQWKREFKVN